MRQGSRVAQGLGSASICVCWTHPLCVTPTTLQGPEVASGVLQGPWTARAPPQALWTVWMQSLRWEPHEALPEHPDLCQQSGVVALKSLQLILGPRVHRR